MSGLHYASDALPMLTNPVKESSSSEMETWHYDSDSDFDLLWAQNMTIWDFQFYL